jgi:hypothetical protein
MNDDERRLDHLLLAGRPSAPPEALRERVLARARDERRHTRRWWTGAAAAAAVWLTVVAGGFALESRESLRTRAMLDHRTPSASDADASCIALADVPGAKELMPALCARQRLAEANRPPARLRRGGGVETIGNSTEE